MKMYLYVCNFLIDTHALHRAYILFVFAIVPKNFSRYVTANGKKYEKNK